MNIFFRFTLLPNFYEDISKFLFFTPFKSCKNKKVLRLNWKLYIKWYLKDDYFSGKNRDYTFIIIFSTITEEITQNDWPTYQSDIIQQIPENHFCWDFFCIFEIVLLHKQIIPKNHIEELSIYILIVSLYAIKQ